VCAEGASSTPYQSRSRGAGGVEKGGLADALSATGITLQAGVGWADEMRVGLIGTMRRV